MNSYSVIAIIASFVAIISAISAIICQILRASLKNLILTHEKIEHGNLITRLERIEEKLIALSILIKKDIDIKVTSDRQ